MLFLHDNILISILVVIDIAFFAFIIMLLKKNRAFKQEASLEKELLTFESLVKEADRTSSVFSQQLEEKKAVIDELNTKIDQRIRKLNLLMNRSDAGLSRYASPPDASVPVDGEVARRHQEILKLAAEGCSIETIARKLSIQRGEVSLVLNMK